MAASTRLQHTIKLLSLSGRSFDGNRSLILGFSDTFAVLAIVLVFAAALVILTKKGQASNVGASRSLCP